MTKHILALVLIILIFSGCKPRPDPQIEVLEPSTIVQTTHRSWIVSEMATEPSLEEILPRYGFTDSDIYILAQLLCGDESYDGDGEYDFVYDALNDEMNYYEMSKVLCVVMNRVRSDEFPDTVQEVIYQTGQFADYGRVNMIPADIAIEKIRQWCEAYDRWDPGVQSIDEDHLYYEAGSNLTNVTRKDW